MPARYAGRTAAEWYAQHEAQKRANWGQIGQAWFWARVAYALAQQLDAAQPLPLAPTGRRNTNGTKGSKPEALCFWLFDLLGLEPADTLDDL